MFKHVFTVLYKYFSKYPLSILVSRKAFTFLTRRLVLVFYSEILLCLLCAQNALFVVHERARGWGIVSFCVPGGDGKRPPITGEKTKEIHVYAQRDYHIRGEISAYNMKYVQKTLTAYSRASTFTCEKNFLFVNGRLFELFGTQRDKKWLVLTNHVFWQFLLLNWKNYVMRQKFVDNSIKNSWLTFKQRKRHLNARNSMVLREMKHICHGSSFWFPAIYCCGLKCCKEDVERVLLNPFSMVSKLRGLFFGKLTKSISLLVQLWNVFISSILVSSEIYFMVSPKN